MACFEHRHKYVCLAFAVKILQRAELDCSKDIYSRGKKNNVFFRIVLAHCIYLSGQILLSPN